MTQHWVIVPGRMPLVMMGIFAFRNNLLCPRKESNIEGHIVLSYMICMICAIMLSASCVFLTCCLLRVYINTRSMAHRSNKISKREVDDLYRKLLNAPDLTRKEIDEIRRHVQRIAQTICEHVWGKKVF